MIRTLQIAERHILPSFIFAFEKLNGIKWSLSIVSLKMTFLLRKIILIMRTLHCKFATHLQVIYSVPFMICFVHPSHLIFDVHPTTFILCTSVNLLIFIFISKNKSSAFEFDLESIREKHYLLNYLH